MGKATKSAAEVQIIFKQECSPVETKGEDYLACNDTRHNSKKGHDIVMECMVYDVSISKTSAANEGNIGF